MPSLETTADRPLRILVIGAHPDDADLKSGGCAVLWRLLGHVVKLVSVTDGGSGHQTLRRPALVERRRTEARAAGALIGAEYDVLDYPDGGLLPTLEARHELIRLIRTFGPDLVLTHRPNDYHPDHRYTSVLVQDAAYMVTVPAVCPETPHLTRDPVIAYLSDDFTKPHAFTPDVVVDVGPAWDGMIDMLDCHVSQFYEWLPYNTGRSAETPTDPTARKAWLNEWMTGRVAPLAERWRTQIEQVYGKAVPVKFVEGFEASEYGSRLDAAARVRLFPFLPRPAL